MKKIAKTMSFIKFILISLNLFIVIGCSSVNTNVSSIKIIGCGTVVNQKRPNGSTAYFPSGQTLSKMKADANVGASVGTAVGSLTGAGFALATGSVVGAILVPCFAFGGALIGSAATAGLAGASGYSDDVISKKHAVFDYNILMDTTRNHLIVRQISDYYVPNNSRVQVIQRNGIYEFRRIDNL